MHNITVWYLVVDDGKETVTSLHASETAAIQCLRDNYDAEGDFAADPDIDVIQKLCDTGLVIYLDSDEITVQEETREQDIDRRLDLAEAFLEGAGRAAEEATDRLRWTRRTCRARADRATRAALTMLATLARKFDPDAVHLELEDSDQGEFLIPTGRIFNPDTRDGVMYDDADNVDRALLGRVDWAASYLSPENQSYWDNYLAARQGRWLLDVQLVLDQKWGPQ